MNRIRNVKMLTLLQLCTAIGVVLTAWFYVRPQNLASAASCGLIDGILFSDDPSVLIDGQVLRVGDSLYGVEIVSIDRQTVTFRGNGRTWQQRVRERPNKAWEEAEPGDIQNVSETLTQP
jgi:hypothetical protein